MTEIKKGDKVRIKKGTTVRSTKEGFALPYSAKRTYTVKVFNVMEPVKYHIGHQTADKRIIRGLFSSEFEEEVKRYGLNTIEEAVELQHLHDLKITFEKSRLGTKENPLMDIYWERDPARVEWAGSGGYWTQAYLKDVEKVG